MAGIDAIKNQSLYFAATQEAARQKAREASKNSKTATAKKSVFANSLQKKQEEFNLASEGLPIELAGMEIEEAVVFLKDELDSAGDKLASDQSLEQIENYRKKLSNFMKYLTRNNYEVLIYKRKKRRFPLIDTKTGKPAYFVQIQVINEKLETLTNDIIYNHSKNLNILAKIEELNGLIVDLLAD